MRVQPHRLGVDGDCRPEVDAFRQIAAMQLMAHAAPRGGAQEKTRTSTTLLPQVPETCASTNSATWAFRAHGELGRDKPGPRRCQPSRARVSVVERVGGIAWAAH